MDVMTHEAMQIDGAQARRWRKRAAHIFLAVFALLMMVATVSAAVSDADLAALGDAEYTKRHAAMRKLLADDSLTMQQLAAAFSKAQSVEQKHRLLSLARHHLLRLARERDYPISPNSVVQGIPGALGLTHGPVTSDELPQLKQSAVRVRRTLPGFPAHTVLEAGDLILKIAGNAIPAGLSFDRISNHFGDAIRMIPAGQSVALTIQRDGQVMEVKVKLGPLDALSGMYRPELRSDYERAWTKFRDDVLLKEEK